MHYRNKLLPVFAALVLAGCASTGSYDAYDPAYEDAEPPAVKSLNEDGTVPWSETTRILAEPVANTEPASVHETIPLAPFEAYPYAFRVQEIHNYWMGANAPGDAETRRRRRNEQVRQLFVEMRNRERPRWQRHQIYQATDTKCKNSRKGTTKKCNGKLEWGSDYVVIPQSIIHSQRHFKTKPAVGPTANVVSWVIGRAGKGTNHGNVRATAKVGEQRIGRGLQEDTVMLRRELEARGLPTDQVID